MNNKYSFLILGIFFIFLVSALQVNTFTNNITSQNLSFSGNQNITRNISIPKNALIDSAFMNLSGKIGIISNDYSFEEISGGNVIDSVGNYNGTIIGTVQQGVNGKIGNAYNFTGNGYVSINNSINISKSFIFSFWMNPQKLGNDKCILCKEKIGGVGIGLWSNADNSSRITFNWGNGQTLYNVYPTISINKNQWYYIVMGYNENLLNMFLIVNNNTLFNGSVNRGDIINPDNTNISIGSYYGTANWIGIVDEFQIYDGILTSSEISKIYNSGNGRVYNSSDYFPTSPYIQINNTKIWNITGTFNTTNNKTNDFSSTLNNALSGGTCNGGTLNGSNCIIPVIFHSDTAGVLGYSDLNITTTDVLLNSLNYTSPITSGGLDNITENITYYSGFSGISVLLNYNGTNYSTTTTGTGYTRSYTKKLTAPTVSTQTNLTFYFINLLSNSTGTYQIETKKYNQTINPFLIDDCSSYTKPLMNFTMEDEDSLNEINGTIEIALKIYSYGTTNLVNTYNNSFNYIAGQESKICLGNLSQTYTLSYQIRYYGNETTYFKQYKNIQRMTLDNNSLAQNITLYDLKITRGFPFTAIVTGNLMSGTGNTGLLIDTQRQYLPSDSFKSIEGSVTDSNGNAVIHLVPNDEIYNFIVSLDGVVLGSFNNYQVKCANPSIGDCSITLSLSQSSASPPDFETLGNITQTFLLNRDTNTLYQTFISTDGLSKTVRSLVLKADNYDNTTICNNTVSGTSGTLICNLPVAYQNSSIFVQTFVNGDYIGTKFFSQGNSPDWKGADILLLLLMFSALTLLFIGHPIFTIIGSILGLVIPIIFISVAGASFGTLIGATFYYIAGGVILIILMNKKKV